MYYSVMSHDTFLMNVWNSLSGFSEILVNTFMLQGQNISQNVEICHFLYTLYGIVVILTENIAENLCWKTSGSEELPNWTRRGYSSAQQQATYRRLSAPLTGSLCEWLSLVFPSHTINWMRKLHKALVVQLTWNMIVVCKVSLGKLRLAQCLHAGKKLLSSPDTEHLV